MKYFRRYKVIVEEQRWSMLKINKIVLFDRIIFALSLSLFS